MRNKPIINLHSIDPRFPSDMYLFGKLHESVPTLCEYRCWRCSVPLRPYLLDPLEFDIVLSTLWLDRFRLYLDCSGIRLSFCDLRLCISLSVCLFDFRLSICDAELVLYSLCILYRLVFVRYRVCDRLRILESRGETLDTDMLCFCRFHDSLREFCIYLSSLRDHLVSGVLIQYHSECILDELEQYDIRDLIYIFSILLIDDRSGSCIDTIWDRRIDRELGPVFGGDFERFIVFGLHIDWILYEILSERIVVHTTCDEWHILDSLLSVWVYEDCFVSCWDFWWEYEVYDESEDEDGDDGDESFHFWKMVMYRKSTRTTTNKIPRPMIGDILAYFAARVSADMFPPMMRRTEKVRIMFSYIKNW